MFKFSDREIKELAISIVVIAIVFGWNLEGGIPGPTVFIISMVVVGLAFSLHELAHKFTAQKYGCWAEYRMWEMGLIMAFFLVVLAGVLFIAPGAVYISPGYLGLTRYQNGIVSVAGAVTNLGLAIFFLMMGMMLGSIPLFKIVANMGVFINAWLAFFNMLPFGPLDGKKVMEWNIGVWVGMIIAALAMLNLARFI